MRVYHDLHGVMIKYGVLPYDALCPFVCLSVCQSHPMSVSNGTERSHIDS